MIRHILPVLLLTLAWAVPTLAEQKWPQVSDMRWTERRQQDGQRQWVDDLAREKLGQSIRGNKGDLETLQRIVHRGLIKSSDSYHLQALGVVLGDLLVDELGLEWKIYQDDKGRSRAACVPNSQECLFPITMLSRRMEVGLLPNVQQIYADAAALIKPHLSKLPYQAKPRHN